jgi:3-hydroxymyristoyl/3-hydroxydecanoyl-(acyl carrier protein) dehydratase
MRWFWIDRFTSFESGRQATAIKAVSLMEEHLDGYFTGYPVMTPSFVLEGFAQVGGILISQASGFSHNVVLAKVSQSKVHRYARPGELLKYAVTLESLQVDGGLVHATSHIDDELQLEADLTFAYVSSDVIKRRFFSPLELLRLLRAYRLFDVAVDSEGNPLKIPDYLLDAEKADAGLT